MMKKIEVQEFVSMISRISVFALLAILSLNPVLAQERNFTITNYFTENYRDFPRMKISIIPPAGFVKDTEEIGFIEQKNSSAIRAEVYPIGVITAADSFLKTFDSITHTDSLGTKLLESYPFKINTFDARLLQLGERIDGAQYVEWRIFIGDAANTYIVRGFVPAKKQKELGRQVRSALLSVFYEPDRRILAPGENWITTSSSVCACQRKK